MSHEKLPHARPMWACVKAPPTWGHDINIAGLRNSEEHHLFPRPSPLVTDCRGRGRCPDKSGRICTHVGCRSQPVHYARHGVHLTLGVSPASDVTHCPVSDHIIWGWQTSRDYLFGDDSRAARKTSKVTSDHPPRRLLPFTCQSPTPRCHLPRSPRALRAGPASPHGRGAV